MIHDVDEIALVNGARRVRRYALFSYPADQDEPILAWFRAEGDRVVRAETGLIVGDETLPALTGLLVWDGELISQAELRRRDEAEDDDEYQYDYYWHDGTWRQATAIEAAEVGLVAPLPRDREGTP